MLPWLEFRRVLFRSIRTKRNNTWSNSSVYSVIKRKQERDGL